LVRMDLLEEGYNEMRKSRTHTASDLPEKNEPPHSHKYTVMQIRDRCEAKRKRGGPRQNDASYET
jgi:hypothetical protein